MMIDRSSFDFDDMCVNDESPSQQTVKKIKDGLVRRKLRWKPPAFRSRNNKKLPPSDGVSVSEQSHRTTKSTHTFSSTETPVQSNSSKAKKLPISGRPNYPDTFEGKVTTIANEGQFIHSRMSPIVEEAETAPRSLPPPTMKDIEGMASFDFNLISEDSNLSTTYQEEHIPHIFDPYGQYLGATPSRRPAKKTKSKPEKGSGERRPPKWSKQDTSLSAARDVLPIRSNLQIISPPSITKALNTSSSKMTRSMSKEISEGEMEWSVPELSNDLFEVEPEMSFSSTPSMSTEESRDAENSPVSLTPTGDYGKSLPMKVPASPKVVQIMDAAITVRSPEPFLAKVSIDLSSRSNLSSIFGYSGLLTGQSYLPDMPITASVNSSPHKSYHRPIDTSMSTVSTSSLTSMSPSSNDSIQVRGLISDDDSASTRSLNISIDDVALKNEDAMVGDVVYHEALFPSGKTSEKCRLRAKTGPVDVDDGAFVEAESHLNAIHEMAAEHLAHREFVEALEVFEEIHRGQQERYGKGHYRVGTALHNIGVVHLKSGNFLRAVEVCEEAVRIRKAALMPNHPDVAASLAQLGVANFECGRYRQALVAFRDAFLIRRECLGAKHPKVGKILNNIGCALYELRELDGARLAFEEALEIQRESLRRCPNTPCGNEAESRAMSHYVLLSIASTLCNLGSIKVRWGHFEEASVDLEEALLIQQSVLGDDHRLVLATIKSIDFVEDSMENGGVPTPSAAAFFSDWNPITRIIPTSVSEQAKHSVMRFTSSDGDTSTNKNFMQSFRWDKSKRWYQKVGELLPSSHDAGCGPNYHDVLENSASFSSWSFRTSHTQSEF